MRRIIVLLALLPGLLLGFSGAAGAQTAPPPGDIKNVDFIRNVGDTGGLTALNLLRYGRQDVLVAVGRFGVKTFDISSDPTNPQLLDHLTSDELRLPGDTAGTFWQSESTNLDPVRKLIFLSRDPRAYNKPQNTGISGVYFVDAKNPSNLKLLRFHEVPAGHTTTCINDCQFLWTGGPAPRVDQPADWIGRPIFVTDIRNPNKPYTYPEPIDVGRRDGQTDYSHDVQVDNEGIAWVSGRGGVRGYWTRGLHWDPVQGRRRAATAWDPVPYAGGGVDKVGGISINGAVHNSERPVDGRGVAGGLGRLDPERGHVPNADDGADLDASGFEPGELLYIAHEKFDASCANTGRFYIASLEGSYDGEGWKSTPDNPFRLKTISSWSPYEQEGSNANTSSCSAHYFRMKDGVVTGSWYGQGTRFLDVRDPYNPRQIAYYRPDGGSSFVPMLYEDLVYVGDSARGIDIIRLSESGEALRASGGEVVAPRLTAAQIMANTEGFAPDPDLGWACRLPVELL